MGNKECKPPPPHLPPLKKGEGKDVKLTKSFSNPSLVTLTSDDHVAISLSQQFCLEYMNEMYQKYRTDTGLDARFPYSVISVATSLVDLISSDDHILFVTSKFMKTIIGVDDVFLQIFTAACEKNVIVLYDHLQYSPEHRAKLHLMYYMKVNRIILTTLEDGKEEKAQEIINLLALSHLIMQITPDNFRQLAVKIIKSMLHYKLLLEDQLPKFVYYHETIVDAIADAMLKYKQNHTLKASKKVDHDKPSRENYRELKKWKLIVLNMRKGVNKQLMLMEKQVEDVATKTKRAPLLDKYTEEDDDTEKWRIIRHLKKGYKYRKKAGTYLNFLQQPKN